MNCENDEEIFDVETEQDPNEHALPPMPVLDNLVLEECPREVRDTTVDASAQLSSPDSATNSPGAIAFNWSPSLDNLPSTGFAVNSSCTIAFNRSLGLSKEPPVNASSASAFNQEETSVNAKADKNSDKYALPKIFHDLLQMKKMSFDGPLLGSAPSVPYSTNASALSDLIKEYADEISEAKENPKTILRATARMREKLAIVDTRMKGQQRYLETLIERMKRNLLSIESKTKDSDRVLDELLKQNEANERHFDELVEFLKAEAVEKEELKKVNTEMKTRLARMNKGANGL